jgi:uncharacterized protein
MSRPLPMFPLGSVLVPHAVLPLHIFEPRYRVMMEELDREQPEFGVVLIERGSEVGGSDRRSSLGTVARVVEAYQLPDGRWVVAAVGTSRLTVSAWLVDDPYPKAEIDDLEEGEWAAGHTDALARAEQAVRRALALQAELGEAGPPATFELDDDPAVATWQLVALAPLGPADRQGLLAVADPGERLGLLTAMAVDAADLLAFRMDGG